MDPDRLPSHSQLFTVRIWIEDLGEDEMELRGKVHHIATGETCFFREWESLIAFFAHFAEQTDRS